MLTKPKNGMSQVSLGNWSASVDYFEESLPRDLLKSVKHTLKTGDPTLATFFSNGWEKIIVFNMFESYVINADMWTSGEPVLIERPIEDIADELVLDIRKNLREWAEWMDYEMKDDPDVIQRDKYKLEKLCSKVINLTEDVRGRD